MTVPPVPLVCVYDKHPHDGICVWWAGSEHGRKVEEQLRRAV